MWVHLEGPADRVRLSLWSVGLTELMAVESGPLAAGGHEVALPAAVEGLPSGTYFFRVEAFAEGRHATPKLGRWLRLR